MGPDDSDPPEVRAQALAEVLRQVALVPGAATEAVIFQTVLTALGVPEEQCSASIMSAIFLLDRVGLIRIRNPEEATKGIYVGATTTLTSTQPLIDFMWREPYSAEPDDED